MLRPIALVVLTLSLALSQEAAWPPEFASIIDEARTYCDGEFTASPEAVVQKDLDGDGNLDWILDSAGFACSSSHGLYCGTGGCGVDTLIDGTLSSLMLHSWEVVTENDATYLAAPNDAGETVRFLWTGADWQLQ